MASSLGVRSSERRLLASEDRKQRLVHISPVVSFRPICMQFSAAESCGFERNVDHSRNRLANWRKFELFNGYPQDGRAKPRRTAYFRASRITNQARWPNAPVGRIKADLPHGLGNTLFKSRARETGHAVARVIPVKQIDERHPI